MTVNKFKFNFCLEAKLLFNYYFIKYFNQYIFLGFILFPPQFSYLDLQTEALQCANHCSVCCERPEHSCPDLRKDCFKRRKNGVCWEKENIDDQIKNCGGTCGLCGRKKWKWDENWMCRDSNWECPEMESFCNFDERIRLLCPKTCKKQWYKEIGFEQPCELERRIYEFRFENPPEGFFNCLD